MHYRTIIISDLHLWTKDSRYLQVLNFLQNNTCDHLILNGDIIDGRHLKIFWGRPKQHTKVIEEFIAIKDSGKTKLTYLIGNHDEFRRNIITKMIGDIDIIDNMNYKSWDKTYHICHGHQFDKLEGHLYGLATLSFIIGTWIYRLNRTYNKIRDKFGLPYHSIVKQIKRIAKVFMVGGKGIFEKKVEKLCKEKEADGLICGHLHKPEIRHFDGIDYLNSGDRVESCTALIETKDHNRELVYWK